MEPNTDQIGLLDLLAMLVENCKLLLLGPALAGLVAFATAARRPLNSRLDTTKLQHRFGLALPRWEQGVGRMMRELA